MLFSAAYISALLLWVSAVSGLPIPADLPLPTIEVAKVSAGHGAETTKFGIKLLEIDKPPTHRDICILAHELTHWLQFYHPEFKLNRDHDEPMAYETQIKCLEYYKEYEAAITMKIVLEGLRITHKWF